VTRADGPVVRATRIEPMASAMSRCPSRAQATVEIKPAALPHHLPAKSSSLRLLEAYPSLVVGGGAWLSRPLRCNAVASRLNRTVSSMVAPVAMQPGRSGTKAE
jgi:hypothetical protein